MNPAATPRLLIRGLRAEGIHERLTFDHEIGPVTVFAGPNEAGKSTAIGTIDLVFLGNAGCSPGSWHVLGEAEYDWNAGVTLDVGGKSTEVTRYVSRGKHEGQIGRPPQLGAKAMNAAVTELVGDAGAWSLDSLLDLAPAKRTAWLEANVFRGAGWNGERLATEMLALHTSTENDFTAERLLVAMPGFARADTAPADAMQAWAREQLDARTALVTLRTSVEQVQKAADEAVKECTADLKKSKAPDNLPAGTVASRRETKRGIESQIEAAVGKLAAAKAQLEEATRLEENVEEQRKKLVKLEQRDPAAAIERRRVELETTNGRAHHAGIALTGARETVAKVTRRRDDANSRVTTADLAVRRNTETVRRLEGARDAWLHAHPYLGAVGNFLTSTAGQDSPERQSVATLHSKIIAEAQAPELTGAQEALGAAQRDAAQARTTQRTAEEELVAAEKALGSASTEDRDAKEAARLAGEAHRKEVGDAATRDETMRNLRTTIKAGRTRVEELRSTPTQTIELELSGLRAQKKAEDDAIDLLTSDAGRVAALEAATGKRDRETTRRTAAHTTLKAISALIGLQLAELTEPVLTIGGRITREVLGSELEVDLERGASFYLRRGTRRIPLDRVASGQSRSPTMIGLVALRCAVLSTMKGFKLLRLDDLEAIEGPRRAKLLTAVAGLVNDGIIDQFIGAVVDDAGTWEAPEGVRVVRLTRPS